MTGKGVVCRVLVLAATLTVASSAAGIILPRAGKASLYRIGDAAASAGDWPEAVVGFAALVELDPEYRDAADRLNEAVSQAVAVVPGGSSVKAEAVLLRWLAASGDTATLAEVLDRCVVTVPAGHFLMGYDGGREDEHPLRLVYLDAYEIDRYEVTNVQYQRFLRATGWRSPPYWVGEQYPPGQADFPVSGVAWRDADAYCAWVGRRLPTEAEWEKACRGADGRLYPWGDAWDPSRANVDPLDPDAWQPVAYTEPGAVGWGRDWAPLRLTPTGSAHAGLRAVGSYPDGASPYGVMDLAGSVSEWVADWYNWDGYWDVPDWNPIVLEPKWNRVLRGSSWYPYGIPGWASHRSRCSARGSAHASGSPDGRVGLRCARSAG